MYVCEISDDYHIELLKTIKESKSMVVISGYDNDLYNTELSDWETDEKITTAQMGLHRTEKIWMNFDCELNFE